MTEDKIYYELRKEMYAQHIRQEDIADRIGKCNSYVSERLSGLRDWTIADAWTIMEMMDIPVEKFHVFFPDYRKQVKMEKKYRNNLKSRSTIINHPNV